MTLRLGKFAHKQYWRGTPVFSINYHAEDKAQTSLPMRFTLRTFPSRREYMRTAIEVHASSIAPQDRNEQSTQWRNVVTMYKRYGGNPSDLIN